MTSGTEMIDVEDFGEDVKKSVEIS